MPRLPKALSGASKHLVARPGPGPPSTESVSSSDDAHVDYIPRPRKKTKPLNPVLAAAAVRAEAMGVNTTLPLFGPQRFSSFEEFEKTWGANCVSNFTSYRVRHSVLTSAHNPKLEAAHEKKKEKVAREGKPSVQELILVPDDLKFSVSTSKCIHGCTQESRGTGERLPTSTRYMGCLAQVTAWARRDPTTGAWFVQVGNENKSHNHTCDENVFLTYMNSAEIDDAVLFKKAVSMISVEGKTKKVLDVLSRELNRPFSRRQLDNFKARRVGGSSALAGLQDLLGRFCEFTNYSCLLIEDQADQLCGLVMQSAMQKVLFERWGDNLILDWTHNTNNLGFYLGSFMVTTASGKGVSVLDFLCLAQTKDMMRAVFRHFVASNPGALKKIRSVVIDKDYKEWAVLEEVFPYTEVVLYQFHVLKWLMHVVTLVKYSIPVSLRGEVIKCLRLMVYAPTLNDFSHQKMVLSHILSGPRHAMFRDYMEKRWYNCVKMWSTCLRGSIFTATNTTSNRLESYWKQLKDTLAKKQRIDLCVEAIFLHGTAVLEREKDILVDSVAASPLHHNCDPFLLPVLGDLSEYAASLVKKQWHKYAAAPNSFTISVVSDETSKYDVRMTAARQTEVQVDLQAWTCSCNFFRDVSFRVGICCLRSTDFSG